MTDNHHPEQPETPGAEVPARGIGPEEWTPQEQTIAHFCTCRMTDWVGEALRKHNLPIPAEEHAKAGTTIGDGIRDVVLGFVSDLRHFPQGVPWPKLDELLERNAWLLVKHVHGLPDGAVVPFSRDRTLN